MYIHLELLIVLLHFSIWAMEVKDSHIIISKILYEFELPSADSVSKIPSTQAKPPMSLRSSLFLHLHASHPKKSKIDRELNVIYFPLRERHTQKELARKYN